MTIFKLKGRKVIPPENPDEFYKALVAMGIEEEDFKGNPIYRDENGHVITNGNSLTRPQDEEESAKAHNNGNSLPKQARTRARFGRKRTHRR